MKNHYLEERQYLKAKKRVKEIKGFYIHLIVYVLVNVFISGLIIFGFMRGGSLSLTDAILNFGVYSTWLFWGIGVFVHGLGVFGFISLIGKDWEDRKIKELMEKEERRK
ncbi:2TM domain-containing protein [Polaribacter sp. HL-MS24]|uniref:2TM domain-containing protein n=1 Tax=Polaribacter sp. HL-MS24 TaxID=3077735 RepID=UPI00293477F7|nr:2TM domain-containing protein [Polaribacter sp. HL-MS24]WOC40035.1 2TM domain-containing protein [Polaribacter sp. HL-MS24]